MKKFYSLTVFLLLCFPALVSAQNGIGETMRSNGRIYVVVAVITTILIGLFIYLVRLDKKIGKFEKENRL